MPGGTPRAGLDCRDLSDDVPPLSFAATALLPLQDGLSALSPHPKAANVTAADTAAPGSALTQVGISGLAAGAVSGSVVAVVVGGGVFVAVTVTVSHGPVLGFSQFSPVGSVPLSGSLRV